MRQSKLTNLMSLEEQLKPYRGEYSPSLIEDFIDYWDEKDTKGRSRWQLEKTWEVGRRLKRRKRQLEGWAHEKSQRFALKQVVELPIHRESVTERVNSGFTGIGELFKKL